MTVEAVAAFADRPNALLYANSCERYGVDPAAILEDDFLAAQLRVALALIRPESVQEEPAPDPFATTAAAAQKVRELAGEA
jgi:hypothetical protein